MVLLFVLLGAGLLIPAIVWLIKAGWVIWRILGIISCVIAIITCILLMYL
jgi:hypothetical protein